MLASTNDSARRAEREVGGAVRLAVAGANRSVASWARNGGRPRESTSVNARASTCSASEGGGGRCGGTAAEQARVCYVRSSSRSAGLRTIAPPLGMRPRHRPHAPQRYTITSYAPGKATCRMSQLRQRPAPADTGCETRSARIFPELACGPLPVPSLPMMSETPTTPESGVRG
jgi:hypothetical protein